jgi:hypothetical protein
MEFTSNINHQLINGNQISVREVYLIAVEGNWFLHRVSKFTLEI